MKPYHGGINFDKWFDRVMRAKPEELSGIKAQFTELVERIEHTENTDSDLQAPTRIINERKTEPRNIIDKDWEG